MGGGQGCHSTSYSVQTAPQPTVDHSDISSARAEQPCPKGIKTKGLTHSRHPLLPFPGLRWEFLLIQSETRILGLGLVANQQL